MNLRSTPFLMGAAFALVAGSAGAATIYRFDVAKTAGSGGAVAFVQSSPGGSALQGQVGTPVATQLTLPFGVFGDYSGTQFGIGVAGFSETGYGVGAESFSTSEPAMAALGRSGGDAFDAAVISGVSASLAIPGPVGSAQSTGVGVYGYANTGIGGKFDAQPNGVGVEAAGFTGGVLTGLHGDALDGSTDDGSYGIFGSSYGGFGGGHGGMGALGGSGGQGAIGYGASGTASAAALEAIDTVGGSDLIASYAFNNGKPSESFIVQSNTANASGHTTGVSKASDVQISGDVYVSGNVYQSCGKFPEASSTDCESAAAAGMRDSVGKNVRMYAARESAPLVEDVGVAHLAGGRIHVALDAAFARTMSRVRPYHVFLTPDGPSRGVYAANRSATGFDVAENPGGSSTLDVEYRIVATPLAQDAARLATLAPVRKAVLASEPATARSIAQAKATAVRVLASGKNMQTFSAERRARMAHIEATLPR